MLDLKQLTVEDARLVQAGLKALGFYTGTTHGQPGALTQAAYDTYLASFANVPTPTSTDKSLTDLLVKILRAEAAAGVREVPKNSNRGARVEEYQRATWLEGSGWAWCAAFICWGIEEVEKTMPLPFARPLTAGAYDFERWGREQGLRVFKPARLAGGIKKGDIITFTEFSHIATAIEDQKGGTVATVEGNTDGAGSREGNGVYEKSRSVASIRAVIRLELAPKTT